MEGSVFQGKKTHTKIHESLLQFEILSRAGGSWESGRTTFAVFQLRYCGCSHAKCDSYATFDLNGYRFRTVLRFLSIRAEIFSKPHALDITPLPPPPIRVWFGKREKCPGKVDMGY